MRANLFWFSDGQWARIEPFIPSNRRGVKPKNNRRILSGIMHVLKSGCRWVDCPPEYGPARKATPVWRRLADVHKAERQIGFKAKVSLEDGLRQLVAWWSRETNTPVKGF